MYIQLDTIIQDTVNSEQYNQWTKNSLVNGMSFNSPLTNFKRFFSIKSRTWSRPKKGKGKGKYLYSALLVVPHTQGAQAWITQCYLQLHQCLPLPRKGSSDCASPGSPDWGCAYLIAAYYSFIYPERMKNWAGLVGWPTADGLPTLVVTRQPQSPKWLKFLDKRLPREWRRDVPLAFVLYICLAERRRVTEGADASPYYDAPDYI